MVAKKSMKGRKKSMKGGKRRKTRTGSKSAKKGGSLFDVAKKYKVISNVGKSLGSYGIPFASDIGEVAGSIGLGHKGGSFADDFGRKFTDISNSLAGLVLPKLGIDINGSGKKHHKGRGLIKV